MPTEVIMPALGMAQETGKLLKWYKNPGEPVRTGEVLFEVETDKSVSEVEAHADGFLTDVTAQADEDVPVGQRIAMISDTAESTTPAPDTEPAPSPSESEPDVSKPAEPAHPVAASTPVATPIAGRILASPKAKRLAGQEGLDLTKLEQMGHPQPYHVSDLKILRDLPPQTLGSGINASATHQITAQVSVDGLVAFLKRMASEGGIDLPASAVLCNFAAAAWRNAISEGDASCTLELLRIGQPDRRLIDPDLYRLSAQPEDTSDGPAALILRDLSGSAITSMQIGAAKVPLINVASNETAYTLSFSFTADQIPDVAAIAFITELAERVADPLPYLV